MKNFVKIVLLVTIIVSLTPSLAPGQDRRSSGGLIDANPQVGSGGINTPGMTRRLNSQLYITGQVTGLARFRGSVPYSAENELGLNPPSASLSRFIQQSIGMNEVHGRRGFGSLEYIDRSRTVSRPGDISSGRTLAGTGLARGAVSAASLRWQLQDDVTRKYAPALENGIPAMPGLHTLKPRSTDVFSIHSRATSTERNIIRRTGPGISTLFGLSNAEDRFRLARQIADLRSEKIDDKPSPWKTNLQEPLSKPMFDPIEPKKDIDKALKSLPAPDEDVFIDVLRSLKHRGRLIPNPGETDDENIDPRIPVRSLPVAGEKVGFSSKTGLVIHSLAGNGNDRFNQLMRSGEFQMRSGRYYSAASIFRSASRQDETNPLADVGTGLALFAAGEPVSASRQLQKAFRIFPALMKTRLDATQLIPVDDLTKRIQQLKSQLPDGQEKVNVDLLFLSTFIHQNTGQFTKAQRDAVKLRKAVGRNKLLSTYANHVLQTFEPAKQIESKPVPSKEK